MQYLCANVRLWMWSDGHPSGVPYRHLADFNWFDPLQDGFITVSALGVLLAAMALVAALVFVWEMCARVRPKAWSGGIGFLLSEVAVVASVVLTLRMKPGDDRIAYAATQCAVLWFGPVLCVTVLRLVIRPIALRIHPS